MIKSFIHELDKQIASNQELYDQTQFEIFKERLLKLESLKSEILTALQDREYISQNLISSLKTRKNFFQHSL